MDTPAPANGIKVLIVDDDRFLLDMYSMKFSKEGFQLQSCLSVDEALDVLRGGFQPQAVLFDLMMPKRNGRELVAAIHAEKLAPGAVLIALTNQSGEEDRTETEKLGIDKYILKASMIPSEVVNTVREAVSGKHKA